MYEMNELSRELIEYLKNNKNICWDINNCDGCFQSNNCGRRLKDIITDLQDKIRGFENA